MKRLLLLLLLFTTGFSGWSQRVYFIYLQTESGTPFYLKQSGQVSSSAGTGFLILPNLVDSSYTFSIGFPGSAAETKFTVPVKGTDRGFIIRQMEGAWRLVDIQTLDILKSVSFTPAPVPPVYNLDATDPFTRMLVMASDDPSLLSAPVLTADNRGTRQPVSEKQLADSQPLTPAVTITTQAVGIIPSLVKDSVGVAYTGMETRPGTGEVVQTDSMQVEQRIALTKPVTDSVATLSKDTVNKIETVAAMMDSTVTQSGWIAAADSSAGDTANATRQIISAPVTVDTMQVMVHPYKPSVVTRRSESSTTEGFGLVFLDLSEDGTDTIRMLIPNPKFTPAAVEEKKNSAVQEFKADSAVVEGAKPVRDSSLHAAFNPACAAVASDRDFRQLRRQMAAAETDDTMIEVAGSAFKERCYSVQQIRNLSVLFLSDAARFRFFEAAVGHSSDPEAFSSLGSELKEHTYIERFKALTGR